MVPIKVNKWNSLVQQVEENRQNILTLSEQPPQFDAKGEWNSTTVYAQNDMINYNGSSYFSLQDSNANHTPGASDSAAWWQLLADKGEQGVPGVQGVQGVPGQTGPHGRGVFAASLVDNEFTVYVENSDVPKNGDVLVVTVNPGTGDNLGDVYLVTNATGTTHIPVANASSVGNIRGAQGIQGPKGDPGAQTYTHYISFKYRKDGGSTYGNFSFVFTNHFSGSMPFSQFVNFINTSFPNGTFVFCGIELMDGTKGGYMVSNSSSGSGSLTITTGAGTGLAPDTFTINNTDVQDFDDNVI